MKDEMIGRIGRIISGKYAGDFMLVEDDRRRTGGYLVFHSESEDIFSAKNVFDTWVEERADIEMLFAERKWVIEWLSDNA